MRDQGVHIEHMRGYALNSVGIDGARDCITT